MSDIIKDRLERMAKWAKTRKECEGELGSDKYVRIGGNGFKAVSVAKDSPLTGFAKSSVKKWSTVKEHFDRKAKDVEGKKEERRLQAFIIKHALEHNKSLKDLLGTEINGESFDDILFSFDEISLGDTRNPVRFNQEFNQKNEGIIRCDLLCVAVKESVGYPILIELKYDRQLGRLVDQLKEFVFQITSRYQSEFQKMLEQATGLDIDCSKVYKCMIWPRSASGEEQQTTKDALCDSGITVFEYQPEYNNETNLIGVEFQLKNYA